MTDEELLAYAKRGLIPGPHEDEMAFLERASKAVPLNLPEWKEVSSFTENLYGFAVDWVPCTYSNHKLPFWEGAATWISEDKLPSIQLRRSFKKGKYFGYQRTEVLSPEAIHAARCMFEEPHFEEILAFRTSSSPLRRFLGPLFRKPWESLLFILFFPFGLFLLMRLLRAQWIFSSRQGQIPLPILICLTDEEIQKRPQWEDGPTFRHRLLRLLQVNEETG